MVRLVPQTQQAAAPHMPARTGQMADRLRFAMPKHAPKGLFRRMPPMAFVPVLALLLLALAWRSGIGRFALPVGLPGLLEGAAAALFLFASGGYLRKLWLRPAVVAEELTALPGRVGLAAAMAASVGFAAVILPYLPVLAKVVLILAIAATLALLFVELREALSGPGPAARVPDEALLAKLIAARASGREGPTPPRHPQMIGPDAQLLASALLLAAFVAAMAGWPGAGQVLLVAGGLIAAAVLLLGLGQLGQSRIPQPLRPLLALHLVSLCSFGLALAAADMQVPQALIWLVGAATLGVGAIALTARAETGRGLFHGAYAVALASVALVFAQAGGGDLLPGLALILATLIVLPLCFLGLRDWARGALAHRSNAAIA